MQRQHPCRPLILSTGYRQFHLVPERPERARSHLFDHRVHGSAHHRARANTCCAGSEGGRAEGRGEDSLGRPRPRGLSVVSLLMASTPGYAATPPQRESLRLPPPRSRACFSLLSGHSPPPALPQSLFVRPCHCQCAAPARPALLLRPRASAQVPFPPSPQAERRKQITWAWQPVKVEHVLTWGNMVRSVGK